MRRFGLLHRSKFYHPMTEMGPRADMAITLTDVRFLGDKADITVIFLYLGT